MHASSPRLLTAVATITMLGPVIALADWPAGTEIDPALVIDVTPAGFDEIAAVVPSLMPTDLLEIDDIYDYDHGDECWLLCDYLWEYEYSISNIEVDLQIPDIRIHPIDDALQLNATAVVSVNDVYDPIKIFAEGAIFEYLSIGDTCDVWLDPVAIDFTADIGMDIVTGPFGFDRLEVTIPPMIWGWSLTGDDLRIDDCALGDILDFFDWLGLNIFDLVIPLVEPVVDDMLNAFRPDLELLIELAFLQANIHEEFDLGGTLLEVDLGPSGMFINPDGLRMGMAGLIYADPHECIEEYGVELSQSTLGTPPNLGVPPASFNHHLGIFADDDFINQGLFAAWSGGLLCFDLDEGGIDLGGLPINTALLGIIAPGAFDELFPEDQDLGLKTKPASPPIATADGPYDLTVDLFDLGLEFSSDVDYRRTRLMHIDLDTTIGTDLEFDGSTGDLAIVLDMGGEDLTSEVTFNEYAPESSELIAESMGGLFDSIVGPLVGGLTGDLSFPIPAFEGLGLSELIVEPAGPNADWLGSYATIGAVTYESTGCDEDGGCDSSGCDEGCSSGGLGSRGVIALFGMLAAFIRRPEPAGSLG